MLAADSLAHLTEFLLLLGPLMGPVKDPRLMVPVQDKAKALLLAAQKGDAAEYRKVLAAIRSKKAEAEDILRKTQKAIRDIEASIENDMSLLEKSGDRAPRIRETIKTKRLTLKIAIESLDIRQKMIDGRAREEQAFTRAYRLVEKDGRRGGVRPTLLTRFLQGLAPLLGPGYEGEYPTPVPVEDKATALLLLIRKGDDSEHKKILALIAQKKQQTLDQRDRYARMYKEPADGLRAARARLARAEGDTAALRKQIAGLERTVEVGKRHDAELRRLIGVREREARAWEEARRLIEAARGKPKAP